MRKTSRSRAPARVTAGRTSPRLFDWIVAIAATLTAVVLASSALRHGDALWRDEVNSVVTASAASLGDFWRLLEFESFPALWLAALRGWMTVAGSSDTALRLWGAAGALSLVGAVWMAARRTHRGVPLLGLAFLAVNADVLQWGSSVRAWSSGAALAVVAWATMRDLVTSPSRRALLLATVASVAAVQATYQNAVFVCAFAIAAAIEVARDRKWRDTAMPLCVAAASLASLLPYAPLLTRRAQWIGVSQVSVTAAHLWSKLGDALSASGPVAPLAWSVAIVLAVVVAATRRGGSAYAALSGAFAAGGLLTAYLVFGYPTQAWYYVGLVAVVAVSVDAVLAVSPHALVRTARVGLAAAVLVTGFGSALTRLDEPLTNMNAVGAHLAAHATAGDLVVANPWYLGVSLRRYYEGRARVTAAPPAADAPVHRYDLLKAAMSAPDPVGGLLRDIQQTLSSGRQVWVVGAVASAPPEVPTTRPPPPLPGTGWNAGPYQAAWTYAVGNLLRDHAANWSVVSLASKGGGFEPVGLTVFRGWR